ncbi:MAG: hypothetical protein WCJ39_06975 [bacterium]
MIIVLILLFIGVIFFILASKKQENKKPNYYTLFTLGVIWLPMGIAFHMYALALVGFLFTLISLFRKKSRHKQDDSWTSLTPQQKFLILVIILGLLT